MYIEAHTYTPQILFFFLFSLSLSQNRELSVHLGTHT